MSVEARYCHITINVLRAGFSTRDIIASDFMFLKLPAQAWQAQKERIYGRFVSKWSRNRMPSWIMQGK